ncbi:unnamed protein product [Nezara viridula]|uniref:Uncharacterized protein n=1 Tax=Nezara viridula TaxID=85310 RepID=A0A9P0HGT3_NEZVI|nr:unnamed protein product [Nezara viridula]
MCPLWPLHIILLYMLSLAPVWFAACHLTTKQTKAVPRNTKPSMTVLFNPPVVSDLIVSETTKVNFSFAPTNGFEGYNLSCLVSNIDIANTGQIQILKEDNGLVQGSFNVSGSYLGHTSIKLCLKDPYKGTDCELTSNELVVHVIRKPRVVDHIFTVTVVILVAVIFVNFGCTLDTNRLKDAVVRPIGPLIGLVCHFLILPLVSYGLGYYFFPDSPTLRLGLFFTGIAPAGGASNIWTFTLGGNLDLSITMTAVSTLASFAFIPLWVLTLGGTIFAERQMEVPFQKLFSSGVTPLICLCIGFGIQVYFKRISAFMVRFLKLFSVLLIAFIICFAVITNFYLFKFFSWQIILGGMLLPWIGYLSGWVFSYLLNQSDENKLAITIETGVQNTGISIFLLRTCLPQPDSDITTVVPVSVALMTPIPLVLFSILKRMRGKTHRPKLAVSDTEILNS